MLRGKIKCMSTNGSSCAGLIDYLEVLAKHTKLIFRVVIAAFFLSIVVSLLIPPQYSSTSKILPPQQDTGLLGIMMSQMGGSTASVAGDLLGKGTPADLYASFLRSDVIKDRVIDRFKLMEVYGTKYRIDTYASLNKHATIETSKKDGIVTITVLDRDPKKAADMANAFVEELGNLTLKLNITAAGQNRLFIEKRLSIARSDLINAENNLKLFQTKYKLLDVTSQTKASIEGIAQLRAQLASQEIMLATMQRQYTESSQEIKILKVSINNLHKQISKLEGGGGGGSLPNVGAVPELGQESLRLMREFKVQEAIVESLTKQYEMTKFSEAKNTDGLQVIQYAQIPDKKTKPKRTVIVLAITFISLSCSIFAAFILEYINLMSTVERQRWVCILNSFRPNNIISNASNKS